MFKGKTYLFCKVEILVLVLRTQTERNTEKFRRLRILKFVFATKRG
jgi:hypothetical protein